MTLVVDPVSAFGGVIVVNRAVDKETAEKMNSLFFEVLMAPEFEKDALEIFEEQKESSASHFKRFPYSVLQRAHRTQRRISSGTRC